MKTFSLIFLTLVALILFFSKGGTSYFETYELSVAQKDSLNRMVNALENLDYLDSTQANALKKGLQANKVISRVDCFAPNENAILIQESDFAGLGAENRVIVDRLNQISPFQDVVSLQFFENESYVHPPIFASKKDRMEPVEEEVFEEPNFKYSARLITRTDTFRTNLDNFSDFHSLLNDLLSTQLSLERVELISDGGEWEASRAASKYVLLLLEEKELEQLYRMLHSFNYWSTFSKYQHYILPQHYYNAIQLLEDLKLIPLQEDPLKKAMVDGLKATLSDDFLSLYNQFPDLTIAINYEGQTLDEEALYKDFFEQLQRLSKNRFRPSRIKYVTDTLVDEEDIEGDYLFYTAFGKELEFRSDIGEIGNEIYNVEEILEQINTTFKKQFNFKKGQFYRILSSYDGQRIIFLTFKQYKALKLSGYMTLSAFVSDFWKYGYENHFNDQKEYLELFYNWKNTSAEDSIELMEALKLEYIASEDRMMKL